MSDDQARQTVFEALERALDNDYDFSETDPKKVAEDLVQCDSDFDGVSPKDLVEHIKAWQKKQEGGG